MCRFFISVICLIVCFQGAYAEHDFTRHLQCFKALEGKTVYNKRMGSYFEKGKFVILHYPSSHSQLWLFVTENTIYRQIFEERDDIDYVFIDGLMESPGNHFELTLPGGIKMRLVFKYRQYTKGGGLKPYLEVSILEQGGSFVCESSFCTTLVPNPTVTDVTVKIVVDALKDKVQAVYRKFSEYNSRDLSSDDFINALNACLGINEDMDFTVAQEIEKF